MRRTTEMIAATVAMLVLAMSPSAFAKDRPPDVSDDVEQKLIRILGQTCGSEDQGEFEGLKRQLDAASAERYLTWVLANGAPERERRSAREAAARRFEMRKAVLAKPNERLFDAETAQRMRAVDRDSYLNAAEAGIDRIYRGNAIRWLGEIAGRGAIPAIQSAAARDLALGRLSDTAIAAIQQRLR
jgi:hypothetical protein